MTETRMNNYENLSDRELDALVAEKVMRWKQPPKANYWEDRAGDLRAMEDTSFGDAFSPSTKIASAFEVVEAMRERGFEFQTETFAKDKDFPKGFWQVRFYDTDWNVLGEAECMEELPRGICIAALRALDE